jgi:hypothetical protein
LKNNKSALDNDGFVSAEIKKLLTKSCISEVKHTPSVVNPLTVAFNRAKKPRLVLDCRHINLDLFKFKYCYEDQSVARHLFKKGDYLFSFDIRGAYHHVMIFPENRKYLGFAFENGVKRFYVYNV